MAGLSQPQIYLIIAFIIFLVFIIISGRILNELNLSKSKKDANIESAHKWAAWSVGIFSTFAALSLIGFIVLFFVSPKD